MSLYEYEIWMKGHGGAPGERKKYQLERKTVLRLPAGSQWLPPPPAPIHAAEVLCEWPRLPHMGVKMVSCQKLLRRGDSGEVVLLVTDGG